MNNELLKELSAQSFAALDLQLYIDTHPDDAEAIAAYNECVRAYEAARVGFEKSHGPLYSFVSPGPDTHFDWVNSPWPWEND